MGARILVLLPAAKCEGNQLIIYWQHTEECYYSTIFSLDCFFMLGGFEDSLEFVMMVEVHFSDVVLSI